MSLHASSQGSCSSCGSCTQSLLQAKNVPSMTHTRSHAVGVLMGQCSGGLPHCLLANGVKAPVISTAAELSVVIQQLDSDSTTVKSCHPPLHQRACTSVLLFKGDSTTGMQLQESNSRTDGREEQMHAWSCWITRQICAQFLTASVQCSAHHVGFDWWVNTPHANY